MLLRIWLVQRLPAASIIIPSRLSSRRAVVGSSSCPCSPDPLHFEGLFRSAVDVGIDSFLQLYC